MPVINVHPILVHFPIALLSLYALLEFLSFFPVLQKQSYWFYMKAMLVIIGAAATIPTILAGLLIRSKFEGVHAIVNLHEHFAYATACIFGAIALIYVIAWATKLNILPKNNIILRLDNFFLNEYLLALFALIGLIVITITGALGGIIAFGPGTDPFAGFVYSIFFK